MKTFDKMIKIAGLLALTLAVAPAFSGAAHAYACSGNKYSGASTKSVKIAAKVGARQAWQAYVKQHVGLEWSVWSIAQSKSIECHKTGTQHTCLVLARPCKYVVQ